MATFLFDDVIFGPVRSRRFGSSLGINLLPTTSKFCNYNCIYCECGWTRKNREEKIKLTSKEIVVRELEKKLIELRSHHKEPDNITFAGNGEPTIHPGFAWILDRTLSLREKYAPHSKITVLSNATMLHKQTVFEALQKVDNNVLKLDTAVQSTYRLINDPAGKHHIRDIIAGIKRFDGQQIIQTMLLRGTYQNHIIDNTTPAEIEALTQAYLDIQPQKILLYSIDRDTPAAGLQKVSTAELQQIASSIHREALQVEVY